MSKRYIRTLAAFFAVLILLAGCGNPNPADIVCGTYLYEMRGFGGNFTVTICEDGTFEYYEGHLSSYIGSGSWALEDDILCLTETNGREQCFRVEADALSYIAKKSAGFTYVKVHDGERFRKQTDSENRRLP